MLTYLRTASDLPLVDDLVVDDGEFHMAIHVPASATDAEAEAVALEMVREWRWFHRY